MLKPAFILFCTICCFSAYGQEIKPFFIEAHYTGFAYEPGRNKAEPWYSGAGLTASMSPKPHFSLEMAYELVPVKEKGQNAIRYQAIGQLFSFRAAFGRRYETWSLRGLVGVGARFANKGRWYAISSPANSYVSWGGSGTGTTFSAFTFDIGMRYTHRLNDFLCLHITTYLNVMLPPDDEMSSSFHPTDVHVLNAAGLFVANVGIAWHPKP